MVRCHYSDPEYPGLVVDCRHWTWAQLVANAEGPLLHGRRQPNTGTSSTTPNDNFYHCSPEEAVRRAKDGWADGVGNLNAALDSLAPAVTDGPAQNMDVNGFAVCIGAYVAGDPECMFTIQDMPEAKPIISLFYQASYSHGVSVQATINYAAALTSLVGELDARGVSTAIYTAAAQFTSDEKRICELDLTPVREPGAPLDLSKVAFSMSAPMHRRIHFAVWESLPDMHPTMNKTGYGLNRALSDDKGQFAREIVMTEYPGAIFLPWIGTLTRMGGETPSAQKILDHLRAAVVASGVQF